MILSCTKMRAPEENHPVLTEDEGFQDEVEIAISQIIQAVKEEGCLGEAVKYVLPEEALRVVLYPLMDLVATGEVGRDVAARVIAEIMKAAENVARAVMRNWERDDVVKLELEPEVQLLRRHEASRMMVQCMVAAESPRREITPEMIRVMKELTVMMLGNLNPAMIHNMKRWWQQRIAELGVNQDDIVRRWAAEETAALVEDMMIAMQYRDILARVYPQMLWWSRLERAGVNWAQTAREGVRAAVKSELIDRGLWMDSSEGTGTTELGQ